MSASRCSTILLVFFALTVSSTAQPGATSSDTPPRRTKATAGLNRLPLAFVENQGQWDTRARFVARRGGVTARLEPDALVLQVEGKDEDKTTRGAVVRLAFEDCAKNVRLVGEKRQPGRYNYFLGNDRDRWRTGVRSYGSVLYRGLYDGIDVRVREGGGRILEYDVLVEPGADLSQVVVKVEGAKELSLAADGVLVIETAEAEVRQPVPRTWAVAPSGEQREIACQYVLDGKDRFRFVAPDWSGRLPLVVDPKLIFSTYVGGLNRDEVLAMTAGPNGEIVLAGWTYSAGFPTTPGAYDRTLDGSHDVFVARLDALGQNLLSSTLLGGKGGEVPGGVAVAANGTMTVVGRTDSFDFPTTPGAFDKVVGGVDGFIAQIDANGGRLLYSTFLGGGQQEYLVGVVLDSQGGVTVSGETWSADFPTTPGSWDTSYNGGSDALVTRLVPGERTLRYSTFLGGTARDLATTLVLGSNGLVTVGGLTASADFPTTPGAWDRTYNGGIHDAIVAQLDTVGGRLVLSTYLGGNGNDHVSAGGLSINANGEITVTGGTGSPNFPTTPGAFDTTYNGGALDVFVTKLDGAGSTLVFSTFIGGKGDELSACHAVDVNGTLTVAGGTASTDFPTTPGAFDRTYNGGGRDSYVARLSASGAGLVYSTFLGGNDYDVAWCLATDPSGVVTVGGATSSPDFPTTRGAYDTSYNAGGDAFAARLAITSLEGTGTHKLGSTVTLALSAPGDAGLAYQLGSSLGTGPIQIGSRKLGLGVDDLLVVSVRGFLPAIFVNYAGVIGTNGQASAKINIPNISALVGQNIHTAFVTLSTPAPQGIKSISNTFSFQIIQ